MIHVIGGGPAGSYVAKLLASRGVTVWEEHLSVGAPVQCTGIVTAELGKMVAFRKEFVLNRLKEVAVCSARDEAMIPLDDIVLCRESFDKYLADEAMKKGAVYKLGFRFIGLKNNQLIIKDLKNNKILKIKFGDDDVLIGADGPQSAVSKLLGNKQLDFWTGVQARVKTAVKADRYSVWFGSIAPEFFAWSVPESATVTRVGLAGKKDVSRLFNDFLNKNFKNKKILEMQGGLIPKFNPKLIVQKDNIFIVGDAAGQVKATTGGGIVPGLQAAECLAEAIAKKKSYVTLLNKKIIPNLKKHLLIRRALDRFTENDYDSLIKTINDPKIKRILSEENRDRNVAMIALKALLKKPSLMKFVRVLMRTTS